MDMSTASTTSTLSYTASTSTDSITAFTTTVPITSTADDSKTTFPFLECQNSNDCLMYGSSACISNKCTCIPPLILFGNLCTGEKYLINLRLIYRIRLNNKPALFH